MKLQKLRVQNADEKLNIKEAIISQMCCFISIKKVE